jgi:hypothetical protein
VGVVVILSDNERGRGIRVDVIRASRLGARLASMRAARGRPPSIR